jgi:branched-chain amino acid transport system ATP-binding protein
MTEPVLQVTGLTRRFGGLTAVDGIALSLHHGQIHALIGPNGAGKSTVVNMLTGELKPASGSILLNGLQIAGLPAHRVSALGIGRSYQKTNVFPPFSAFENCRLAAQSRRPRPFAVFRDARSFKDVAGEAEHALQLTGLTSRAGMPAEKLSHGEQRQLEIAMALATRPEVLLLDEPLAGMGAEESAQMVELLKGLRQHYAILLVEHDMDAVFALADTLTVMTNGRVLETGTPAHVRASTEVQEAYLGDGVTHA